MTDRVWVCRVCFVGWLGEASCYGDSHASAGEFIRLLCPDGIPKGREGDLLTIVRMFDKMKRIMTDPSAFNEDPWADIAGYAILKIEERRRALEEARNKSLLTQEEATAAMKRAVANLPPGIQHGQ